jgi:type II secretory pathway pseudopilin PulG
MMQCSGNSMIRRNHRLKNQRGYILLVLMFFVAALAIASLAMVQNISMQMKRDREEELIHRGVQYSRAVRRYFKKFGRYPTRIEDLENTNNIRFLRKRYKDPMTGKDFKLLHMTDVQVSFNPGAASMLPPTAEANVSADQPVQAGAPNAAPGPAAAPNAPPGSMTASTPLAANQSGDAGTDQNSQSQTPSAQAPDAISSTQRVASSPAGPGGPPQTFGGGAIIGVASTSKLKTIREFNKRDHYNQWQFIYDPSTDRGGLLMTPNQPPLQGAVPLNQQNGVQQNGGVAGPGQGMGLNTGFGSSQGVNATPQQPQQNPVQPNQQ